MANTTTSIYNSGANQDNTYRSLNFDYKTTTSGLNVSGSTISVITDSYNTFVNLGTLTAGTTDILSKGLTYSDAKVYIGNKMEVIGVGPATGTASVVFGSNFKMETSNTVTVSALANMKANFTYNGTYWVGSGFSI